MAWFVMHVLLAFACVVLHEFGHALTARRFGVRTRRILLTPIGGMAEFESIPRNPRQEMAIALAGPAVNFVLIGLILLFVDFPAPRDLLLLSFAPQAVFKQLVFINLMLGCFNLIPVFPMDGGRVLRAALALRLPYLRATQIASRVGKALAVAGALAMLFLAGNPMGAVLFAFIFYAADREYKMVRQREAEAEYWRQWPGHFHPPPPPPPAP
jgi:Zn-dependent protease